MKSKNLILLIITILVIAGNIVFLTVKYRAISTEDSLKKEPVIQALIDQTAKDSLNKSKELLADEDFKYGNPNAGKVFENFYHEIKSETTFRIKVWGKDYQVIWSDLTELIGKKFPDNKEVKEAFDGEEEFEIKVDATQGSEKSEILTESLFNNYAEIYTPIRGKDNKVVGLIELYKSLDAVIGDLRNQFYKTALLVIGGSVILLLALALFLKKIIK